MGIDVIHKMTDHQVLILSRQNIKDIPGLESDRLSESRQIKKGAYVVYATSDDCDITLLANGSEVATLIEAAPMLEQIQRLRVRVVSVPSEGIFRTQPDTLSAFSVLPDDAPVFGLTAGLPVTLEGLIKDNGMVFGMTHFGYSAPYPVLDEKFGFTAQNVVEQVKKLIADQ
jgi:transketolase